MLKYLLVSVAVMTAGCNFSQSARIDEAGTGITRIDASVEYVGPGNIRLDREQYPRDVLLVFPYISGSIFGDTGDDVMFAEKLDASLRFTLALSDKISEIESRAVPLSDEWRSRGLEVVPKTTSLARVGTFPYSIKTTQLIGYGGFIDPESRNTLILIYVDSACVISGKVMLDNERFSHHIVLPGRGFHWVQVTRDSHNSYSLERYTGSKVNFSIHIQNLVAT